MAKNPVANSSWLAKSAPAVVLLPLLSFFPKRTTTDAPLAKTDLVPLAASGLYRSGPCVEVRTLRTSACCNVVAELACDRRHAHPRVAEPCTCSVVASGPVPQPVALYAAAAFFDRDTATGPLVVPASWWGACQVCAAAIDAGDLDSLER